MSEENQEEYGRASELSKAIDAVAISFIIGVIANMLVLLFFKDTIIAYAVIPFNLAFVLCVAWLSKCNYGWTIGCLTVISIFIPIITIFICLLSLNSSLKELKENGFRYKLFSSPVKLQI